MIVSDANDCTIARDSMGAAIAARLVPRGLQANNSRIAWFAVLSLSLNLSLYTYNLSLSIAIMLLTTGIDNILKDKEKDEVWQ